MIQLHSFPEDAFELVEFRHFDQPVLIGFAHGIPFLNDRSTDEFSSSPFVSLSHLVSQRIANVVQNSELRIEMPGLWIVFGVEFRITGVPRRLEEDLAGISFVQRIDFAHA